MMKQKDEATWEKGKWGPRAEKVNWSTMRNWLWSTMLMIKGSSKYMWGIAAKCMPTRVRIVQERLHGWWAAKGDAVRQGTHGKGAAKTKLLIRLRRKRKAQDQLRGKVAIQAWELLLKHEEEDIRGEASREPVGDEEDGAHFLVKGWRRRMQPSNQKVRHPRLDCCKEVQRQELRMRCCLSLKFPTQGLFGKQNPRQG